MIALANALRSLLQWIAHAGGWLLVVLATITCIEVFARKLGFPVPLTKLQELEWHVHTAIFSAWMGYNYAVNAHPRVDSYTETLAFRTRAWIELVGCLVFALPFMLVVIWYGWDFWVVSFRQDEFSENPNGLPWRWIPKGIYYVGLWLVVLAIVSVMLRLFAFLFGGRSAEDSGLDLGHTELEV